VSAGPLLRVVRGAPDDAELAALTAVVAALSSAPPEERAAAPRSAWGDPGRRMRALPQPGPGAWPASGLPS
jgi:hypothetical protein